MKKLKFISSIAAVLLLSLTVSAVSPALASTLKVVQTPKLSLYAGISSSATSMRITPFPRDLDGIKLTMTDLGTLPTLTIDPGVRNIEEIIGFTGITDNGDNTATLTGLSRNLISKYPYSSTGTGRAHNASAIVVFSNNPQVYGRLAAKENDEAITGLWSFNSYLPTSSILATTSNQFVTYGSVIGLVVNGAATATQSITGISRLATAIQQASSTLSTSNTPLVIQAQNASSSPLRGCDGSATAGALCVTVAQNDGKINANYIGTSSSYTYNWGGQHTFNSTTTLTGTTTGGVSYLGQFMQLVSSTTINTASGPVPVFIATSTNALVISEADVATTTDFLGFATSTNVTNGATGTVQISGIVNGFSGLTKGLAYYVQDTRGTIGTTVGTAELYVGTAVSATQILLDRKDSNWQYLGSATCSNQAGVTSSSCDTISVPFSRFAVVSAVVFTSACIGAVNSNYQLMVAKVGVTTQTITSSPGCDSGHNPTGYNQATAQFTSTSSVRITISGAANVSGNTQTAYFYR